MGNLTISMAIFNNYFDITRGYLVKDQAIDSLRSAPVMFCHRTSLSMGHGGPLGTDTEKDTQENPRGGPPYFALIC